MKNLDWKKINNDKDFQRLVNDLFALEINNPSFLSSSPEIGKDSGWDGRYEGFFMNLNGIWSFQAKWTKHDLNKAFKYLQGELKRELEKAKKNGVKYLLFATNADLRVGTDDHVGKLEKLNKDNQYVEHLFVWPKANLESRIIQYPWLRHYYFDDCQKPMFVPPQIFAETEPLLSGGLIDRDEETKKIKDFILGHESNILIIHSAGGYGKTHFITEVGKMCNVFNPSIQAWFCRPYIRDVNDAVNDELNHQKDYLIFLDDAERYLDDAKKLIAHARTYSPGKLKVILSCRTSGKGIVENLASSQRIDKYSVLELSQISEKGLIEILTRSAGSKPINHPDRIVKELNGNLFLIVTTGKLIKGGEIDPKLIKKQIKDNLDQEAVNALKGLLNEDDTKRLVRELSIIVPFSKDRNNNVIEKLSVILTLNANKTNDAIIRLLKAKVLRTVGASIRFNPDMKGDIYLSVELDQDNGEELVNQIFENWLSIYPEKLTANLASASRHSETDSASKAIKGLINKWIAEVTETSDSLKSKRLELVTPVAYLAPEEVINLIYAYLNSSSAENIYSLNRDSYGPVIYQILHIPKFQSLILKLVLSIDQKNLKGTYNNYIPATFVRQMTSPIEVNINLAIDSLSELSEWTKNKNCTETEAKLASEGSKEALSGSHEHRESYGNQITFGRRILVYKDNFKKAVDQFRDKGMEVLKNLVFHPNDKIKKIGIEIVDDIGYEASSTSDALWTRILSDKTQAVGWLKTSINKDAPHEVLSSIEDVLIRYWANNNIYPELSIEAANILRAYSRSPEYIIFRYFVAHDIIISNFTNIESKAPESDRWSWLVHNHFRLHDLKQEDLDEVIKQLSVKYSDKEKIIEYLKNLEKEVRDISRWQYIPLIETWFKFNEPPFIEIVNNKVLLNDIPAVFHRGIYRVASDKDKKYISAYAEEILAGLSNLQNQAVDNLLDLISRHNVPVIDFLPWLSKIIEKSDTYLKHLILHRAYFVFKDRDQDERNKVIDVLRLSLEGKVDNHVLDMVNFLLHSALQWNLPKDDLNKVRLKLTGIIKDIASIDYNVDELLKFVIDGDLDRFIDLIDYRLNKHKTSFEQGNGQRFDPIPYDGFRSSENLIKSYDDFSRIMDKINFWKNEELLYSFDIDNLLKNLKNHDEKHGDYLRQYIDEKIKEGGGSDLKIAVNALFGVPFGNDTADLFLNLMLSAEKVGALDDAKEVFSHQVLSGSYSSTIGEAPPALSNKKDALTKIYKKCPPGIIKNFIDALIKSLSDDIQRHLDEGQELISPKS